MIRHEVGYGQIILEGDVRECLASLPPASVHCCVTSIPYWGLRSYGTEPQVWGATDPNCEHEWGDEEFVAGPGQTHGENSQRHGRASVVNGVAIARGRSQGCWCRRCPAWCGELGSEPTPKLFVQHVVEAFRAVRRVLRDDGVLWLNVGDCFAADGKYGGETGGKQAYLDDDNRKRVGRDKKSTGLKSGDLVGIPWMIAFALRDDGWWLREDWVWAKKNSMPESVSGVRWVRHRIRNPEFKAQRYIGKGTDENPSSASERLKMNVASARACGVDHERGAVSVGWIDCPGCEKCRPHNGYILRRGRWRHTRAHEFVFMLAKSESYWANQEAVREPCVSDGGSCFGSVDSADEAEQAGAQARDCERSDRERYIETGKNPRSWAAIASEPNPEPHFAAFPTQLIAPLIRATCPDRCCSNCGAGWAPVIDSTFVPQQDVSEDLVIRGHPDQKPMDDSNGWQGVPRGSIQSNVLDYWPTCDCCIKCDDANCNGHPKHYRPNPGTVIDPFLGSGTTLLVARQLGLNGIGCELSKKYVEIAKRRITGSSAERREPDAAGQRIMFETAS